MNHTLKNILIGFGILVLLVLGYYLFFGRSSGAPAAPASQSGSLTTSTGVPVSGVINQNASISQVEATKIGQEFINQLLSLQAIKLNDEIFSSLAFQSLEDFTIVLIQSGNEGRPNPFAPFGADGETPNSSNVPVFTPDGTIDINAGEEGAVDPSAWLTMKIGNVNVLYPPTWMATPSFDPNSNKPDIAVAALFTLPGGSTIAWGGAQSACGSSTYPAFQYGVSTRVCIKNLTVQINGQDPSPEVKTAFGDFIVKNR